MNRKFLIVAVLFTVVFTCFAFAKNEIKVGYIDGMISVDSRIANYVFDASRGELEEVKLTMEQTQLVYRNDGDGLRTTLDSTPVYPSSIAINGKSLEQYNEDPVEIEGDVSLVFDYGVFEKEVKIIYGPLYEIDVSVSGNIPNNLEIIVPRVGFAAEDRTNEFGKVFTNYYEETKAISIWAIKNSEGANFKVGRDKNANTIEVPYNGLNLHGYMGEAKKNTFIKKAFPDNYVWLSRTINSYPKATSWYDPIFYLFVGLIDWLFKVTGSYRWAIILFTLIIRLIIYPLFHIQTKSMIERKKLEDDPEFKKLNQIKDKQKKQQELMKFYKRKKVNPAGGCLPLLVQMPVFILLYAVIRYQSELFAYGPQFFIWEDLSVGGFAQNIILVLISAVMGFLNSLITSSQPKMAMQGALMATFFPFILIMLPTGLQLYWVTSTIFQFVVTYYVYKKNDIHGISIKEFFASLKKK